MAEQPETKKARLEDVTPTDAGSYLEPLPQCTCPLMDQLEAAEITLAFQEAEARLPSLMEAQGTAIVTGVLEAEDIRQLEAALREDLEELVDIDALAAAGPSVKAAWRRTCEEGLHSWPAASLADVGARGRFQDHGLPHGRFAWQARTNERVRRVYEILHGTADLVSSCDNAFVANASQEEAFSNKNWPHVDQNDHDARILCKDWNVYQGLLYVWSSDDSSHRSTTVIWPGSHKAPYSDYMGDPKLRARIAEGKPHFSLISAMEAGAARDRLIRGWTAHGRRMPVPAGALLLWTSRTTHQGWSGGPRLAQPVCWEPRCRRDELMRERKLRLTALGLPSTHWASLALPHELSTLQRPKSQEAVEAADHEKVRFPLRFSIRSQALTPDADLDVLWQQLQAPSWFEPLPAPLKVLLESSISEGFKAWL